ncbi:hypothetical protein IIA15_09290, partial [candidate division TA06 bacterium]|nr:hypothetical protein [candidate division TA06 bacterium]
MLHKANVWMAISVFAAIIGCKGEEGPQGPQGPPDSNPPLLWIFGQVTGPTFWNPTTHTYFYIYKFDLTRDIPSVKINSTDIPLRYLNPDGVMIYDKNNLAINPGDSANFTVTYTKTDGTPGSAWANGLLPGTFEITSHDTSLMDTLT